ncbi:MAG TPA: AAC(3) family N-acetyltransferase [Ktedonobacteraceae bacterium]|nr:AAC(3) family N-acetyltransferase [Ktedonobacteraceae bacterium]
MSEQEAVDNAPLPRTRASLANDLRELGVEVGMTLLMHSSLKSLGWVCGGPVAVIQALMDVVTPSGTIVVPTQSAEYSDPAKWQHPPVPESWWQIIYDSMPAFDLRFTPTRYMGVIAETFRTWPGVLRSNHPAVSFAAWGRYADQIVAGHTLEYGLGEGSPLARIYDLDGWVLLLGVGHDSNTSMHLAEYRAPGSVPEMLGAPVVEDGQRIWKSFPDIEIDSDIFPEIGAEFEQTGQVRLAKVGSADARLFRQRAAVDFGELPEETAVRETQEETGVTISDVKFRVITSDVFEAEQKHYITVWFEAKYVSGEPKAQAPEEESEVGWFTWDALPQPLFLPLQHLLEGQTYPSQTTTDKIGSAIEGSGVLPHAEALQ